MSPDNRLTRMAWSTSLSGRLETAADAVDVTRSIMGEGQDRHVVNFLRDLDGPVSIGQRGTEVVSTKRCESHPGQGCSLARPIAALISERQEPLPLFPGALEVAQDCVESCLVPVDRNHSLRVHCSAELPHYL
jgi:hypothetical protein